MSMSVSDARVLLAAAKKKQVDIDPLVRHIDERIRSAAVGGEVSVSKIFCGIRGGVTEVQARLVREHYVSKGFAVIDGDTISWEPIEYATCDPPDRTGRHFI